MKWTPWTNDDIRELMLNWRNKDDNELEKIISHPSTSIISKRTQLGLIRVERKAKRNIS